MAYIHPSRAQRPGLAEARNGPKRRRLDSSGDNNLSSAFQQRKLPQKSHKNQQYARTRSEASSTLFKWNSLFMNPAAVLNSVAQRLGIEKSAIIDPTSSNAAIKQAHAETHVIQETKAYLASEGVNIEAFQRNERGDTAILIKNLPFSANSSQLRQLLEQHGPLSRFLVPPSGTIAIAEYAQADHARAAFSALAYRRFGDSVLFLERAPIGLFNGAAPADTDSIVTPVVIKPAHPSATELLEPDSLASAVDHAETSSIFVKNLNFTTTSEKLVEHFRPLDGFISGRVKTKPDMKNPGQTLSMGFGFLEFRTVRDADTAIATLDGSTLEGHALQLKKSQRTVSDSAKADQRYALGMSNRSQTKLIIKNLPFEASRQDLRSLLGAYGKLRTVRVPKKFNQGSRGFGFAEFVSAREAENAIKMLQNTHLLGRRLVFEFAKVDSQDAEEAIQEMIGKVGKQVARVNVAKLVGRDRKRFRPDEEEDVD